jgi:hypothetical protein
MGQFGVDALVGGSYVVGSVAAVCKVALRRVWLAAFIVLALITLGGIALGIGMAMLEDVIMPRA